MTFSYIQFGLPTTRLATLVHHDQAQLRRRETAPPAERRGDESSNFVRRTGVQPARGKGSSRVENHQRRIVFRDDPRAHGHSNPDRLGSSFHARHHAWAFGKVDEYHVVSRFRRARAHRSDRVNLTKTRRRNPFHFPITYGTWGKAREARFGIALEQKSPFAQGSAPCCSRSGLCFACHDPMAKRWRQERQCRP